MKATSPRADATIALRCDHQLPARGAPRYCRELVVGCGLIGRQRADALLAIESAQLAATVDPVADSPAGSPAPHYETLADVPGESYEAAVICAPHDVASELARTVLRSGKPVLIEKPLGTNGAQARELERLAALVPWPSFVGYNYRFLPIHGLVRSVASGELGRLRNLDLLVGHGGHPGSADGWKLDPVRAGGGVLLDPGVHLLDLLLILAPSATCTSIAATRGFWRTGIEEDVVATFQERKLIATVRVSHFRWVNTFRVEAHGEDGYAIAEGRGGHYGPMSLRRGRRWAWRDAGVIDQRASETVCDAGAQDTSLRDELSAVVAAWTSTRTDNRTPQPADMAQARKVTELCERLYARIDRSE